MKSDAWRGSTTVEAAIVMPVFLVLLVTMLMFAMFIYEKAIMRSVCNRVVSEGAQIWPRGEAYMNSYYERGGVPEKEYQDKVYIYQVYANYFSNLVDLEKKKKIELVEKQLVKELARHSFLLTESDITVEATLSSVLIHKHLTVNARANYTLPFYSNTSNISTQSVISGQTEVIRTIDFAVDLLDGPMAKVKDQYDEMIQSLQKLISKVKI